MDGACMGAWVHGCMGVWVCMGVHGCAWVHGCMGAWVCMAVHGCIHACMRACVAFSVTQAAPFLSSSPPH
jgi:hypothetical protein